MCGNQHVRMTAEQYDEYSLRDDNPWGPAADRAPAGEERPPPSRWASARRRVGTAAFLVKLAAVDRFADVELIGLDYFEDMVCQAGRRVERACVAHRVRIELEDVHALSYPEGFARWVISRSTIHHWSRPVPAFQEIHRVLAPGGTAHPSTISGAMRNPRPSPVSTRGERQLESVHRFSRKVHGGRGHTMCRGAGTEHSAVVVAPETGPGRSGSSCGSLRGWSGREWSDG